MTDTSLVIPDVVKTELDTQQAGPDTVQAILAAFFAGKSPLTLKAYARDIQDYARFLGVDTPEDIILDLLSHGRGHANSQALAYQEYLRTCGLQPATINRRLAALRALVDAGETVGAINWTLKVKSVKAQSYKDTRGPGLPALRKLLDSIDGNRPQDMRDRAMIRLLFDLALRRKELCGLLLSDLEMDASPPKLWILGKGRSEKEALTIPPSSLGPLATWLHIRGETDGPLFYSFSRRNGKTVAPIHPDS
jgi:integrase/recombinase XerC